MLKHDLSIIITFKRILYIDIILNLSNKFQINQKSNNNPRKT